MSRKTSTHDATLDRAFLNHLGKLGLESAREYRDWCRGNGFSTAVNKSPNRRAQEVFYVTRAAASQSLKESRQQRRNPHNQLLAVCNGDVRRTTLVRPYLVEFYDAIHKNTNRPVNRAALRKLILLARGRSKDMLDMSPLMPGEPDTVRNSFLMAMVEMARHNHHWIRPLSEWKRRSHNRLNSFRSLIRHLFVRHSIPHFFDKAWVAPTDKSHQLDWYLTVAAGHSIRKCTLPVSLTKRMGHHFMHAPDELSIDEALRWSQVLGEGGSPPLARNIIGSQIGTNFGRRAKRQQEFWSTVIRWFCEHPMLDPGQVAPIVDYLHYERHIVPPGAETPNQPNLCMKGRTPGTLLDQVDRWHRRLAKHNRIQLRQWDPLPMPSLDITEGKEPDKLRRWQIRELLSTKALMAEGRQLSHCVASYAQSCVKRHCSIWTMECTHDHVIKKLVTIEVAPLSKRIVQARGKLNRRIKPKERQIMERWARDAGLKIAAWV